MISSSMPNNTANMGAFVLHRRGTGSAQANNGAYLAAQSRFAVPMATQVKALTWVRCSVVAGITSQQRRHTVLVRLHSLHLPPCPGSLQGARSSIRVTMKRNL